MNQTKPKSRRWLRVVELALFFVGVAALVYCGYVLAEGQIFQRYQEWAFEQQLDGRKPSITGFARALMAGERKEQPSATGESYANLERGRARPAAPRSADRNPMIGRIEIPRLKVSAMVMRGTDEKTLRRAVGWISGTSDPGAPGNVAVAAHRDSFFRPLRDIKRADKIVISTLEGKYVYEVDSIEIVKP